MKLLIVESPAKAKTISKYLDDKYTVKASIGHVRDLPKSNKDAVDIDHGFKPKYVISPKKKEVVAELKKLADKADEIVLATDPDREGEAIAWHVAEALGLDVSKKNVKRIAFHEITKEAVQEAMLHPRGIDQNLKHAQEARRVLDRLFGYDLSGLIWKKVRYGLSAGRVQSPALRILVEREREISAFEPETYWVITADLKHENGSVIFTASVEPRERGAVEKILDAARKGEWSVKDIEEKHAQRNPRAPFKTSTLQSAANSRLGFSPSRTMRVAQKLYEAGLITYMRTDSTNLAVSAQNQILKVVESEYGKEFVQKRNYKTKSKVAQEAHESIRPTSVGKKSAGANPEQKKLYELIWRRAVASQMKSAKILRTKIVATVDDDIPEFSVNGSRTLFDGWLKADPRAKGEDVELPKMQVGDDLKLLEINDEEKETQPPNRYSEAGLVKELEKRGIGRPSTYASIIATLEKRGYVDKENRSLKPTDTGEVVSTFLETEFKKYISDSFTAKMEDELDEIADGKGGYVETLEKFYGPFHKEIESKQDIPKLTTLGDAPDDLKCPKCGADMVIKLGRSGKFLSCSRFPDCDGARTIDGKEIEDEKPIGKDPDSDENVYIMEGPYGPYVQLGEKVKGKAKPKRASIPEDKKPEDITLDDALHLLSLPRTLGEHPDNGNEIQANIGRFGPYIAEMKDPKPDYRSLKEDDPYTITLERALEILSEPKKRRGGKKKSTKKSNKKKTAKKKSTKKKSSKSKKKKK